MIAKLPLNRQNAACGGKAWSSTLSLSEDRHRAAPDESFAIGSNELRHFLRFPRVNVINSRESFPVYIVGGKDGAVSAGAFVCPALRGVFILALDDTAEAGSNAAAENFIEADFAFCLGKLLGQGCHGFEHRLGTAGGQPGVWRAL